MEKKVTGFTTLLIPKNKGLVPWEEIDVETAFPFLFNC